MSTPLPPLPNEPSSPPAPADAPPSRAGNPTRRNIAAVVVLVGAALALWSLFLPWKRLVPPAGYGLPDDQAPMIPINFYHPNLGDPVLLALVLGPIVLLAICALALLLQRGHARRLPRIVGVIAAIVGLAWSYLMLAFTGFLNDSIYVYQIEAGSLFAFAGYVLAIIGCVIAGGQPKPTTLTSPDR